MRKLIGAASIVFILIAGYAVGETLPKTLTYNIYIAGTHAGTCVIEVEKAGDVVVFSSESDINIQGMKQSMKCRTELGDGSPWPTRFTYEGTKLGNEVSGTVWVENDSIFGDLYEDGVLFPSRRSVSGPLAMFENYVIEHQIIILRALATAPDPYLRFGVIFPSNFTLLPCVGAIESEIELATVPKPTICEKFSVMIQNSSTFFGYYDRKRGAPVYLDFPSVGTEIFLASAFEEDPVTKYVHRDSVETLPEP